MGKKSKKKRNRTARKENKQEDKKELKIINKLTKALLLFITLIGGFVAILSLMADISVEARKPLQTGDLKSTPMLIANHGLLGIYDVSYICKELSRTQRAAK